MAQQSGFNPSALAAAEALHQKEVANAMAPNIFQVPDAKNSDVSRFPVQLGSTDPQDAQMALRKQLVGEKGVVPGMGIATVGPEYFNYVQRKEDQLQQAQFEQFIFQNADLSSPAAATWFYEHFPELREKKLAYIDQVADLQKKFAKINAVGPMSREDYELLWMLKNNIITIPNLPVHKLSDSKLEGKVYQSGFFSPWNRGPQPPVPSLPSAQSKMTWSNPSGDYTQASVGFTSPGKADFLAQMRGAGA